MKTVPHFFSVSLKLFTVFICTFTFFRLVLLFNHYDMISAETLALLPEAMRKGFVFDMVISSYAAAAVFLFLLINMNIHKHLLYNAVKIVAVMMALFVTAVACADLPYFNFYNARINKAIFTWVDSPGLMWDALAGTAGYYGYFALFAAVSILLIYTLKRIFESAPQPPRSKAANGSFFILGGIMLFFGVRGDWDFGNKPAVTEDAFFSDYTFINQLAINPIFNLIDSYNEFKIDYPDTDEAIARARAELGLTGEADVLPLLQKIEGKNQTGKPNVVLVLMESMSLCKTGRGGKQESLTPFLDSLAKVSLYFPNTFSAGIHTHNGIFCTLYGEPALMDLQPMVNAHTSSQEFTGLAPALKAHGYSTAFFCTNNRNFDNMGGFLGNHGFDRIISMEHYPAEATNNCWGVPDHFMFDFAADTLNRLAAQGPFFATFLTISTHTPHIIPAGIDFKPSAELIENAIYQYADWSIARFMHRCSKESWYNNTIFVFIADHGQNFDPRYEMPLTYHHIPLIIHMPGQKSVKEETAPAMQIDVFPTVMALTGLPYTQNTPGINLLNTRRRYAYFTADDKLGVVDSVHFMTIKKSGTAALYDYRTGSIQNLSARYAGKIADMKQYAYSFLKTVQYQYERRLAGPERK